MLFAPTALILADHAQRDLLDSARLDGRTTPSSDRPTNRVARARQPLRFLALRSRPAV